uniref:sigma-54-dependent Fis family transcriptional regulator n=1 Tax=uncultured Halomonas sp. TaxID=173971 RepID=UPI0026365E2C|nr:sigma 54-interacting transcriptional regulator [uncultured Halomonas sp.]
MSTKAALRTTAVMRQAHDQMRYGQLPMDLLDASIGRSWQRCQDYGLSTGCAPELLRLSGSELRDQCDANHRLISLVDPLANRVAEELGSCQLLLACPDATVLKSYGKRFVLDERLHITPGISLNERWFGTNAPALARIENAPVLVKSSEHLLFPENPVSCVASPLFDVSGDCLGLIDLTFGADHPRPETFLRRVQQLTKVLEQQLFRDYYQQRWVLQIHASLAELDGSACGLIAINDDGLTLAVDAQAAQWLGRETAGLIGNHIELLLGRSWTELRHQCENVSVLLGLELADSQLVGRLSPPAAWRPATLDNEVWALPGNWTLAKPSSPRQPASREPALASLVAGWPQVQAREAYRASRALVAGLPVLLQGETGTGKEQLARALHSDVDEKAPFVALNCAALPESLIEAELFGYGEGAFTGARKGGYGGRLVQANGGTLLLDEIGDMPLALQARLLRVLQERVVTPLGDHREVPIECRVIAASHRDLEARVEAGEFREDLFYRLAGVVVELPALNQQLRLVEVIHQRWAALCRYHSRDLVLEESLGERLAAYDWPGNWRELEHCLEVALVGAEPELDTLTLEMLSPRWQRKLAEVSSTARDVQSSGVSGASQPLRELQQTHMQRTLEAHGGNYTAAARTLGVSRSTLYRRLVR